MCRILGTTQELLVKASMSKVIPDFLAKRHKRMMVAATGDMNFSLAKKDEPALAVHASGYLVPIRLTVWRQQSFTDISQFNVIFSPVQYRIPTLQFVTDKDEVVRCATSGWSLVHNQKP